MKKSYRKNVRRTVYGRQNKSYTSSPVYKLLSVMSNPFSNATDQPKIPDGLYVESFGERINSITTIGFNETVGDQFVDFKNGLKLILTPSIVSPYLVKKFNAAAENIYGIGTNNQFVNVSAQLGADNWLSKVIGKNSTKSVRIVSCGYRIQLMNNADDNEGFFTCGRRGVQIPMDFHEPETLPGFVCGKLRDIHKFQFNVYPTGRQYSNMPFIMQSSVPGQTATSEDEGAWVNPNDGRVFEEEDILPTGFDNICLKITGGEKTKIMIFCALNIEFTVPDTSVMRRFMTQCISQPDLVDKALPRIKRDLRAAIPFTGSFPLA